MLSEQFKLSILYGNENECLMPGRLQVFLQELRIPEISTRLDSVRHQMKKFVDSIKIDSGIKTESKEKAGKKHKKKKRHRENPEESVEKP
jgi:hypothetical protein